jgi:phosphoribosylformimino-5-aminoimidazole carboxamide ribotide isomerase
VILYPAVDIRDGKAVRLVQGDYERETVYDTEPLDAAQRWVADGAEALHVVDLDGAREGRPVNVNEIARIASAVGVPIQVGGGLRDSRAVERLFDAGVERAVLGSAALHDPDLVGAVVDAHGARVVVSVDTRGGKVAVSGWLEHSAADPAELIAAMADRGVRNFVYTPVEVDGTLEGPAVGALERIAAAAGDAGLIYSGGIGALEDLKQLAALEIENLTGVIVGRALYEGRFTVAEAQAALG